jgi:hypothetical protein
MSIKFPSVHIAESVVNRILNLRDELGASRAPPPAPSAPPAVPDPSGQGALLDAELDMQPPPVTADDDTAPAIALKGLV